MVARYFVTKIVVAWNPLQWDTMHAGRDLQHWIQSNANLVSHEVDFLKRSLVRVVMMMMITMIDD